MKSKNPSLLGEKITSTAPCPCGSGQDLDNCCGPVIANQSAPTAEALMRSRYSAFVLGNIGYLADTLGPEIIGEFDQIEAESIANDAKWQGLEIRAVTGGGVDDETGSVEFISRFRLRGEQRVHHELSNFRRQQGRWVCSGGQVNPKGPPRQAGKVGRNEACPCGSGRKYKKCCGA